MIVTASLACLCGLMCWRRETKQKPNMNKADIPFENPTADPDFPPPPHSPTLQEIFS